jgi:hypothetical protein
MVDFIILILILLFLILFIKQICNYATSNILIEGLESSSENHFNYERYPDSSQTVDVLVPQNKNNIQYITQELMDIKKKHNTIVDLSNNVTKLDDQVKKLSQAQSDTAYNQTPKKTPDVKGTA